MDTQQISLQVVYVEDCNLKLTPTRSYHQWDEMIQQQRHAGTRTVPVIPVKQLPPTAAATTHNTPSSKRATQQSTKQGV